MSTGRRGRVKPASPAPPGLGTLEENAVVLAAVVESALDAVIVVDEAGLVVTLNPAAETTFGYPRSEAVGRDIGALIVPDHLKKAHETGMARYRTTREPHVLGRRVEMDARCKDGRIIPVELAITEVNLPGRRYFTANLRDLSAARAAEAEIERQRDALHQSKKLAAIGSLLAGVAHELNNPLSIVLGQATMLREQAVDANDQTGISSRAAKIEAAAERCARIVRSFLAIARQRKAEERPVDVAPLLEGSIDLVGYGLKSNGVVVTRAFDDKLPRILVDPDQVQQILVNLLVNASQVLEEVDGRREIHVSTRVAGGGRLSILIADNGPGIPPEIAERIFDPFFTTKPQGVGTGIGLSISRGLAESQGGQLRLATSPQGGAAFELILPLALGEEADRAVRQVGETEAVSIGSIGKPRPGRHVIVIDDEVEVAMLLAEALHRAGYRCDVATSGREAQALIAANPNGYDAIICDLRMPDMDGPSLFRWISTHHPDLVERTLFVTGDALGQAAGRFLAKSGRPFLEKPFTPAEIARLIAGFPAVST
jgi:PAS domain S-box-containing protein